MPAIVTIRAKHMPASTAHELIRGHDRGLGRCMVAGMTRSYRWPCQRCGHPAQAYAGKHGA